MFSPSEQNNPCAAWYYPKYPCYTPFAIFAFFYTVSVHALFHSGLLRRPQITQPMTGTCKEGLGLSNRRKVAIVTGSNTGVGFQTAKTLVTEYGFDVILACRSRDKAQEALNKINFAAKQDGKRSRAIFLQSCDLSSFASIKDFAKVIKDEFSTIDILVNNAGLNTTGRTEDGYDLLFQSCYLGHFLLTRLIFELFPDDGTGRIVNLSSVKHHFQSNWTGWVSLDEYFWKSSALLRHKRNESYPNAKQALIFFTLELNRCFYHVDPNRKNAKRVRAFAANPGAVNSDIWRSVNFPGLVIPIFRLLFLTTEEGCATSVAAAVGQDFDEFDYYLQPYWMPLRSKYTPPFPVLEMMGPFIGYRVTQPRLPCSNAGIRAACDALWKVSEELTGHRFDRFEDVTRSSDPQHTHMKTGSKSQPRRPDCRSALGLVTNTAPRKEK